MKPRLPGQRAPQPQAQGVVGADLKVRIPHKLGEIPVVQVIARRGLDLFGQGVVLPLCLLESREGLPEAFRRLAQVGVVPQQFGK